MTKHFVVVFAALAASLGFSAQAAPISSDAVAAKTTSADAVQKVANITGYRRPGYRGTRGAGAYLGVRRYGYAIARPYSYGAYRTYGYNAYRPYRYGGYYAGYRRGLRTYGRYHMGHPGYRRMHYGVTRRELSPRGTRPRGTGAMTRGQGARAINRGTGGTGPAGGNRQGQGQ